MPRPPAVGPEDQSEAPPGTWYPAPLTQKPQMSCRDRQTSLGLPLPVGILPLAAQTLLHCGQASNLCLLLLPTAHRPARLSPRSPCLGPSSLGRQRNQPILKPTRRIGRRWESLNLRVGKGEEVPEAAGPSASPVSAQEEKTAEWTTPL
ncbi:hypothetical protein EOD39_21742 [Acipenser ruthenus]|uniref:Uncharacterized protein n=1 Tax=Acipenser ruthenus TaxID=7906 RepID=A0A444URU7_ACIRT|nr:hypothetical protein EOD39_21742 [Acipenser ruthenus]